MNQSFEHYQNIAFKNWIKKRFINEIELQSISYKEALLWCEALEELSKELIDTLCLARLEVHEIVPFRRSKT